MDSTRPIRALLRGLDALAALNVRESATVSELVGAIRLPRTTVYRVLETLCDAGYVHRDPADERYRLTAAVRGLSDSLDALATLAERAEPAIAALARSARVSAGIATRSGRMMRQRECDATGQHWNSHYLPLAECASGRTYLAHCAAAERAGLRAAPPARGTGEDADEARWLCLPLHLAGGQLAVLTVRSIAVMGNSERQRLLDAMRACASSISGFNEQQPSGAHSAGVPATAH